MTVLLDSPHRPDHPFSRYVANLRAGSSVSWFSQTASVTRLREYVWGVMNLRFENTRHSDEGFARTSAETVLFIAAVSPRGSILTCFPLDEIGLARINDALEDEHETMLEQLSRGTYAGNTAEASTGLVDRGHDVHDSGVFDFVNGASIARLRL